jgi:N-acetylmuramoyl-L-alanine amidase
VVFTDGNPFWVCDAAVYQLPRPPELIDGALCMPLGLVAETFSLVARDSVRVVVSGDTSWIVRGSAASPAKAVMPPDPPPQRKPAPAAVGTGATPEPHAIHTIVIDPGHGGKDPGAVGPGGTQEKDVVLPIALALRDELAARTDMAVFMTRSTDVFVELADRTRFANNKDADLFVSIHANSIAPGDRRRGHGYEVFFLSEAKNDEDKRVAMLENSVVNLEKKSESGDFVKNIIAVMAANEFLAESQDLSIVIAETFGTKLKKIDKIHTGVGQGPFWVLFGASMPSVLIETGYISDPLEEKLLADSAFQKEMAAALCDAVIKFREKYGLGL